MFEKVFGINSEHVLYLCFEDIHQHPKNIRVYFILLVKISIIYQLLIYTAILPYVYLYYIFILYIFFIFKNLKLSIKLNTISLLKEEYVIHRQFLLFYFIQVFFFIVFYSFLCTNKVSLMRILLFIKKNVY